MTFRFPTSSSLAWWPTFTLGLGIAWIVAVYAAACAYSYLHRRWAWVIAVIATLPGIALVSMRHGFEATRLLEALALAGGVLLFVALPPIQAFLQRLPRTLVVLLTIPLVLLVNAQMLSSPSTFPVMNWSMYTQVRRPAPLSVMRVWMVSADGAAVEFVPDLHFRSLGLGTFRIAALTQRVLGRLTPLEPSEEDRRCATALIKAFGKKALQDSLVGSLERIDIVLEEASPPFKDQPTDRVVWSHRWKPD